MSRNKIKNIFDAAIMFIVFSHKRICANKYFHFISRNRYIKERAVGFQNCSGDFFYYVSVFGEELRNSFQ
jgi:hypothetical protein